MGHGSDLKDPAGLLRKKKTKKIDEGLTVRTSTNTSMILLTMIVPKLMQIRLPRAMPREADVFAHGPVIYRPSVFFLFYIHTLLALNNKPIAKVLYDTSLIPLGNAVQLFSNSSHDMICDVI